ncbi:MAG: trypsin-like peptidase domain-containing protein [Patescibacteria group bacterium]|nr:trypsin-like peptidase domain-containing protein [Patescibacteria group bacterium]MDE2015079.1 trypsin-like peptidase domain-containing protein [Patescibacteria group bacterium]MDE2226507.1 trypsin-like peptidase domain-containing protein [Patescibacteria group bacterium]
MGIFKENKKFLGFLALGLATGLFFGGFINAQPAKANFFNDFFNNLISPFLGGISTSTQMFGGGNATGTVPPTDNNSVSPYKPVVDYEKAVVDAVKKASPAVVSITISKNVPIIENCPQNSFGNLPPEFQQFFGNDLPQFSVPCDTGKTQLQEVGGGSGFIISSDGLILTNKHVAGDKTASYTVFTNDGKKYNAKISAVDPSQDLAVLKIDAHGLPTVELGDSDAVELGQTSIAIGNALGEFRNTVSVGVISGLARTVTASGPDLGSETIDNVIQTDAAINPGNSGGPLLNLSGQVIGINTAIAQGAQSIGFAIPINRAKRDISSVKVSGEISVPYLGVRYIVVTPDIAKAQKLAVDYGALVRGSSDGPGVIIGSPADKAGIEAEDIILQVNNQKIDSDHSLGAVISQFSVGDAITIKINRNGKEMVLSVKLEKRPVQ